MSELRLEQGEQGLALTNGLVTIILKGNRGSFDILSAGRAVVSDASVGVSLRDGPTYTTRGAGFFLDGERHVTDALGRGLEVVLRRESDELEPDLALSVTLYEGSPHVVLRAEVANRSAAPIRVQSFSVLEGGRVDLGSAAEGWRFFEEGWQNWSVAVVLPISGEDLYMAPPVVGPTTQPDAKPGRFVAELVGAVVDPATNTGVVAGFISTANQFSQVWFNREGTTLTAASYADGVTVTPGQRLSSERLLVQPTAVPLAALQGFGDAIAAEMRAVPWPEAVEGWCSWYYYWQGVSEKHILANLGYLAEHRRELPVEYVQVDDGYQAEIGDWLTPNDKFPQGMGWIANQIHQRGFKAGLWLAPFMIGAKSQLWQDHPDWAVQYKPGKPYVAMINWAQECYSMDLTRPDVMDWLEKVLTTVFDEWKFDYIKIDFLYAGAVDGIRSNPNVTRAQAYRGAIEKIREIAGERFILGCGHPMGPSIGIMNGSRISPDVAPFWYPHEQPREEGRSDLSTVSTFNAIRNTMVRFWMHDRIWLNDPDCMLARDTDTALTLAEVQSLATVISLSGGMMLDSDNLTRLSPERRDMISMLQPVYGKSAVPLDLFQSETPQLFQLDCGAQKLLGVFNWADQPAEVSAPLPDEPSHVFEVWGQKYLGGLSTSVSSEIPVHGCRLYAIRGMTGRPQVIGSTFHLLQGTMEITREDWTGGVMRISLRPVAKAEGELFIHVPEGFGTPTVDGAQVLNRGNGAWSLGLRVDGEMEIAVRFGD